MTPTNLRPRLFDGGHLDFPGMNQAIRLQPHQKDAVWRVMSGGNTLLAQAVGAGKTFTMAATGMKLKQAGLIRKPMYVVPNHLLEQFGREFLRLYPNARLLVAGKEDLTRDRRKFLTAKMASGEWDGILVTHSSFERIGLSRAYQERFLLELLRLEGALTLSCGPPPWARRANVRFDRQSGALWAGDVLLGETPIGSREYYFLDCLARELDQFVPYRDIKRHVLRHSESRDTTEEATFAQGLKSRIKKKYVAKIDLVVGTSNKADGYRLRGYTEL